MSAPVTCRTVAAFVRDGKALRTDAYAFRRRQDKAVRDGAGQGGAAGGRPSRSPPAPQGRVGQSPPPNAASNEAAGGSKSNFRNEASASGAPCSRSMPASSHSTDTGPS